MYYRINAPRVVHEFLDGEVIAIDFETGSYYSLRGVAAGIWCQLAKGSNEQQLVDSLVTRFELDNDTVTREVTTFLRELIENALLLEVEEGVEGFDITVEFSGLTRYSPPQLNKFSDMEQLLLLDPIHEVDEVVGWPLKK